MNKTNLFLLKHNQTILTITLILISGLIGLYINWFTKQPDNNTFISNIQNLSWKNLLLVLTVALLVFHVHTLNVPKKITKSKQKSLVSSILESASKSLIYPNLDLHIRAIVTVCDNKTNKRVTCYNYNTESDPERVAEFEKEFGVTGEAFTKKSVVLKQLKATHHKDYDTRTQNNVLPQIKTVLAAPILKSNNTEDEPFGILAFDSMQTIQELYWNKREIRTIAQEWADILSEILVDNKLN